MALVKHLGLAGLHEAIYPREHETNVDGKYLLSAVEKMRHQFNSFYIPQVDIINFHPSAAKYKYKVALNL